VRLNTDPTDSSVKEEGIEICSSTPCDVTYRGAEADPTKEHKLLFSKAGYKVETKTIKIGDSPVTVKLTKAPVQWVAPPPQQRNNNNGNDDKPPGFKDLPY